MKILILTQNENLYLPSSFAQVCQAFPDEIACIVIAPAMSTHGGPLKGFLKHFNLFGWMGTCIMGSRVITAKLKSLITRPKVQGPFYSIQSVAAAFKIPLLCVNKLTEPAFFQALDHYQPELLISISCPQIIGKKIRERFPKGCINVHGAPLPKYRGLMPAFWVLLKGEKATATTVHDLSGKLDDGDILVQREVRIEETDTWDSLVKRTKKEGASALIEAIQRIKEGKISRRPNLEAESTYFSFPTSSDRKAFLASGRRFF